MRAATHEALFGLLAVSGVRVGEALALRREDVDLGTGVITIQAEHAKLGRSRLVPLHQSATAQLRSYAAQRERLRPRPRSAVFFLSAAGGALGYRSVCGNTACTD